MKTFVAFIALGWLALLCTDASPLTSFWQSFTHQITIPVK